MRAAMALLGVVLLSIGCYRVTGQLRVSTKAVPELVETKHVTVPVPEHDSVVLSHRFDDDRLVVCATRQVACEDRETRTYRRTEVVERELPWHHWLVLGGGAVLGGAGAYLWTDSGGRIASGESIAIGGPSQEMAYDEGKRDMAVGVGLVVGGGLLLVSEVADLIMARDNERPLPDTSETSVLLRRTCGEESVGNCAMHARGAGGTQVDWRADGTGCVSVDVTSDAVSGMPFAEPFVTVQGEKGEGLVISLPPSTSARLVAKRRQLPEIDEWLSRHGHMPEAGAVELVRAEVLRAEMEGFMHQASIALDGKMYEDFARLVGRARKWLLENASGADGEGALRRQTEALIGDGVASILAEARSLAGREDYRGSLALLDVCLALREADPECSRLKKRVEGEQADWRLEYEEKRPVEIREMHLQETPSGYLIYFSTVNGKGQYTSFSGKADYSLVAESNGFPLLQADFGSASVTSEDFQVGVLGRGLFARNAYVYSFKIGYGEFWEAVGRAIGLDDSRMARFYFSENSYQWDVYLLIVIEDPEGNKIEGRTRAFLQ